MWDENGGEGAHGVFARYGMIEHGHIESKVPGLVAKVKGRGILGMIEHAHIETKAWLPCSRYLV